MNLQPGEGSPSLLCSVQEELSFNHISVPEMSHSWVICPLSLYFIALLSSVEMKHGKTWRWFLTGWMGEWMGEVNSRSLVPGVEAAFIINDTGCVFKGSKLFPVISLCCCEVWSYELWKWKSSLSVVSGKFFFFFFYMLLAWLLSLIQQSNLNF